MTERISDKDKKDWEEFLSSNEKLQDKDYKLKKKKQYKTRSIDLHGYSLEEANETIQDFIQKSYDENVNKLIVVTGKGLHSNNEKDPPPLFFLFNVRLLLRIIYKTGIFISKPTTII